MMTITVPASSANLGPGFDSLGLALTLPLTVTVLGPSEHWLVDHPYGPTVPNDADNLIVKSALTVADLPAQHLGVTSDVPLARGLGSSAQAIVAGLILGHQLAGSDFTKAELLAEATALEGHPDNVAPAIFGGLQLTTQHQQRLSQSSLPLPGDLVALTVIPQQTLSTAAARAALPKELPYQTAVQASQNLAALVAACFQQDQRGFQQLVESDCLHEPYRQPLAPDFALIRDLAHNQGFYGTYLSGAGPTSITLLPLLDAQALAELLKENDPDANIQILQIDTAGYQVKTE
ncbi:homoserine kinase [Leuconostocaceae bacterium ESL0958]|nr:homoserine kinase [Leuconostocaceae bacterium ESL0958]